MRTAIPASQLFIKVESLQEDLQKIEKVLQVCASKCEEVAIRVIAAKEKARKTQRSGSVHKLMQRNWPSQMLQCLKKQGELREALKFKDMMVTEVSG